ncbi:hypothetical protein Tco_1438149 [Tanacetum coccineum]
MHFSKYSHLPSALRRTCRRQGYMIRDMERKYVTTSEFWKVHKKVDQVLHEIVPQIVERATEDLIENNLKPCIAKNIIEDRNAFRSKVPDKVHEQVNHVKRKTIIHTSDDDQIDSNIIFDDPYVENNGGTSEHDSTAHDEYHDIKMLAHNVPREIENKKRLNNELKKQKHLLKKELETFKDWKVADKSPKEEMPRLVNLAVKKDSEVDPINNTTFNLYPTPNAPSSSTATVTTADTSIIFKYEVKTSRSSS